MSVKKCSHLYRKTLFNLSGWRTKNSKNITITDSWKHPEKIDKYLKSTQKDQKIESIGFHNTSAPVFLVAQFFGVMPVSNIMTSNLDQLKLNWLSFRVLNLVITGASLGLLSVTCVLHLFIGHFMYWKIIHTLFNVVSLISLIWFTQLALKWQKIIKTWCKLEQNLNIPMMKKIKSKTRIRVVSFLFLFISLIEHILSLVDSVMDEAITCDDRLTTFEAYMFHSAPMVFYFFPYSLSFSVFLRVGQNAATFIWWYKDLFVMVLSMGLSSLFSTINDEMFRARRDVEYV